MFIQASFALVYAIKYMLEPFTYGDMLKVHDVL